MLGSPQRGEVIEPEFGHSIKARWPHSVRMTNRVALDEPAEPGDAPPDGPVLVVPVARELIDRHAGPAGNAVNELDHDRSLSSHHGSSGQIHADSSVGPILQLHRKAPPGRRRPDGPRCAPYHPRPQ